jgi:hypothetical protein
MGLSGHFQTLSNLCVNIEPLEHIQHEACYWPQASFDVNWTKLCIERYELTVLFLQDIFHTSHLPSTKYKKSVWWGALLKSVTYS